MAAAGFSPGRILPVVVDVGTNNRHLKDDPLYLGLNRERLSGPEYYEVDYRSLPCPNTFLRCGYIGLG